MPAFLVLGACSGSAEVTAAAAVSEVSAIRPVGSVSAPAPGASVLPAMPLSESDVRDDERPAARVDLLLSAVGSEGSTDQSDQSEVEPDAVAAPRPRAVAVNVPATTDETVYHGILPPPVAEALRKTGLPASSVGVYVQDVATGRSLVEFNADTAINPASVMKMVTTLAGVELLGPAYQWSTGIYADGPIENGRLDGSLYIKGNGDPWMVTERFWTMLRQLKDGGLTEISGDLVLDNGYFQIPQVDPGSFDGQTYRAYNVPPQATLVNFRATQFRFWPDKKTGTVRVTPDPPSAALDVRSDLKLIQGKCRSRHKAVGMDVERQGSQTRVRFHGNYPSGCGNNNLLRAVTHSANYEYGVFRALWESVGGTIRGGAREGRVPAAAERIFGWPSLPLAEAVRNMNKYSNNVMTRQLLLTIGARVKGAPGTLQKGREAISEWMLGLGVDTRGLRVDNGSGLSRIARISPRTLGQTLALNYASPFMPEFVSSLPISAIDGTLRRRFRDTPVAGQAHMKTGLLANVRAIAGYVQDARGRVLAVAVLQNHVDIHRNNGVIVQDATIEWAYSH